VEVVAVAVAVEGVIGEVLDVGSVGVPSGGGHGVEWTNGKGVLV